MRNSLDCFSITAQLSNWTVFIRLKFINVDTQSHVVLVVFSGKMKELTGLFIVVEFALHKYKVLVLFLGFWVAWSLNSVCCVLRFLVYFSCFWVCVIIKWEVSCPHASSLSLFWWNYIISLRSQLIVQTGMLSVGRSLLRKCVSHMIHSNMRLSCGLPAWLSLNNRENIPVILPQQVKLPTDTYLIVPTLYCFSKLAYHVRSACLELLYDIKINVTSLTCVCVCGGSSQFLSVGCFVPSHASHVLLK